MRLLTYRRVSGQVWSYRRKMARQKLNGYQTHLDNLIPFTVSLLLFMSFGVSLRTFSVMTPKYRSKNTKI